MPRQSLLLALTAASTAAVEGSSERLLIGDVFTESGSTPSRSLNEQNEAILKAMLGKETFHLHRDECLHEGDDGTAMYGQCDISLFPFCTGDTPNICFNRVNRQDAFWPDKHPRYYIDYDRVRCYPNRRNSVDFACSSCSPGRWCVPEGRCILDENLYGCWAAEDAAKETKDEIEDMIEDEIEDEVEDEIAEDATAEEEVSVMVAMTEDWEGNEVLSDYRSYSTNEIEDEIKDKVEDEIVEDTATEEEVAVMVAMTEDWEANEVLSDYPTYSPTFADYPTYSPTL